MTRCARMRFIRVFIMYATRLPSYVQDQQGILSAEEINNAYADMLAKYQKDTGNVDIAIEHVDACLKLAAASCIDKLATYFANNDNSTISSDSVDHGSKADSYRRIANGYRSQYNAVVINDNKSSAYGKPVALPKRQRLR